MHVMTDNSRNELARLLHLAGREMSERGDASILSDFDTCASLGTFLTEAASLVETRKNIPKTTLWRIFAPTCDWDDAGGSQAVANSIFVIISDEWRPSSN
jgi:hypothetical protein